MKLYTKLLLLATPLFSLQAQAQEVYLNSNFDDQTAKAQGYTWVCEDGMGVKSQYVKKIFDDNGGVDEGPSTTASADWFMADGVNGNRSRVMMSYSKRTHADVATDNWLYTPQLDIKNETAWLAWDAQSVHYHQRESYEVYVCTDKDDFDTFEKVYETSSEDYFWTHHLISLAKYQGLKVYVAFVHTSTDKYLLALDNIYVGELPANKFEFTDLTKHSASTSAPTGVNGTLRNIGADVKGYTLRCTTVTPQKNAPSVTETKTLPLMIKSNDTFDYHFDAPLTLNKCTTYTLEVLNDKGEVVNTQPTDSIFASQFARTLLYEKNTAFWCTSCPKQNPFAYWMEHHYGDRVIEVVAQYPQNNGEDTGQMANYDYMTNLRSNNLPALFFDRSFYSEDGSGREERMLTAFTRPCYARTNVASATCDGQTVKAKIQAEFAGNLKNENNRYAVGVTLTENIVDIPVPQQNLVSTRDGNEYFYLPGSIPSPLNYYVNVVREASTAFTGLKGMLPEQIEKDKVYEAEYSMPLPSKVRSLTNPLTGEGSNLTVVAMVMNTATKEVINASKLPVEITGVMGIEQTESATKPELAKWNGAYLAVFPKGEGTVSIYSTDGRLLKQGNDCRVDLSAYPAGTYIVTMHAADGQTVSTKLLK